MKKSGYIGGQKTGARQIAAFALLALTAACGNEIRNEPPSSLPPRVLPPLAVDPSLVSPPKSTTQSVPASRPTVDAAPASQNGQAPSGGADASVSTSPMAAPSPPEVRENLPARIEPSGAAAPDAAAAKRLTGAAPSVSPPPKPTKPAAVVAERAPAKPAALPPKSPTLNVEDLKTRLRDTQAIGVFTKLALKNQMDDLLKKFQTYHREGRKGLTALRQPYDMLVLKVLAVLQDGDPDLARAISSSREAIWNLLADPDKFNALT